MKKVAKSRSGEANAMSIEMSKKFDEWFEQLPKKKQDKMMLSAIVFASSMLIASVAGIVAFALWLGSRV